MRDAIIVLIYAIALIYALRRPFVGVMVYFWISFMNPHRYTWGFAYSLPLAMGAAAVTFLSIAINHRELKFPRALETGLFFLLWIYTAITSALAFYPDWAWQYWETVTKIFLMTFIAMTLITTRERLRYFILLIIGSIGFIGIKGAIFGLATGGQYLVWGPPESFIADNNSVGLAMVMITPLCLLMRDLFDKKWQKLALLGFGIGVIISAVLTYSRGALVGLMVVGFFYFLNSKHKIAILITMIVVMVTAVNVLPAAWFERMNTIKTYEEDRSANMRLNSWKMSINIAKANFFGGGFDCFSLDQYEKYAPDPDLGRAKTDDGQFVGSTAHSVYFEVLATQGFLGLAIYLSCLLFALVSLRRLVVLSTKAPEFAWISGYGRALFVSIIAFMASGTFLSRAFFDLFWALFAAAVCLKVIVYSGNWIEADQDGVDDSEKLTSAQNQVPIIQND